MDKIEVPLDELLWAMVLIEQEYGRGSWENKMPVLWGVWETHRLRVKELMKPHQL